MQHPLSFLDGPAQLATTDTDIAEELDEKHLGEINATDGALGALVADDARGGLAVGGGDVDGLAARAGFPTRVVLGGEGNDWLGEVLAGVVGSAARAEADLEVGAITGHHFTASAARGCGGGGCCGLGGGGRDDGSDGSGRNLDDDAAGGWDRGNVSRGGGWDDDNRAG